MMGIACDHAGVALKTRLMDVLQKKGEQVLDFGCDGTASVDYPDFAFALCESIQKGKCDRGILICGTGVGMSIAANKCRGIRAALCWNTEIARLSRAHNDSNVLVLGARVLPDDLSEEILLAWLEAPDHIDKRHFARLDKISKIEEGKWQTIQSTL